METMRNRTMRGLYAALASLGLTGLAWADEPKLFSLTPVESNAHENEPAATEPTPATEEPAAAIDETSVPEVFRERYPNRAIKVERHVVLDSQLNYVNHGPWSWWDERGQLIARGEYRLGKRHGSWVRVHGNEKGTIFALPLYKGFERPLVSTATLEDGELHGAWTVADTKGRKASQLHFEKGKQHGQATWWHPTGQVQRTCHYKEGVIDGELKDFNVRGEVVAREVYVDGFRQDVEVANHAKGKKRTERSVLVPIPLQQYDWFEATVTTDRIERPKVYHGPSVWWHPDGQKEMVGQYEQGVPNGTFTWWHANGQEHIIGQYSHGQQEGKWIWWYANGQKEMEGEYHKGQRVGKWAAWTDAGKIRLAEEHPAAVDVPATATAPRQMK
jgi:antitoxin component YwqK of YwqJK toxin-antitoxin module